MSKLTKKRLAQIIADRLAGCQRDHTIRTGYRRITGTHTVRAS